MSKRKGVFAGQWKKGTKRPKKRAKIITAKNTKGSRKDAKDRNQPNSQKGVSGLGQQRHWDEGQSQQITTRKGT